jgi:hypothetical protein
MFAAIILKSFIFPYLRTCGGYRGWLLDLQPFNVNRKSDTVAELTQGGGNTARCAFRHKAVAFLWVGGIFWNRCPEWVGIGGGIVVIGTREAFLSEVAPVNLLLPITRTKK